MKQLFFSLILFSYGSFCDMCADFCTHIAEKKLSRNKELNKKLLIFMSNFSDSNFVRWQKFEHRFIEEFSRKNPSNLP